MMNLLTAFMVCIFVALPLEGIGKLLDKRGSDLWWWFRHKTVIKNVITLSLSIVAIGISAFGVWWEWSVTIVWFGYVAIQTGTDVWRYYRDSW